MGRIRTFSYLSRKSVLGYRLCGRSGPSINPGSRQIVWSCGGWETHPTKIFLIFNFFLKKTTRVFVIFNDFSTLFVVNHSHRDLNSLSISMERTYHLVPMSWIFRSWGSYHTYTGLHVTPPRVVVVSLLWGRHRWLETLKIWRLLPPVPGQHQCLVTGPIPQRSDLNHSQGQTWGTQYSHTSTTRDQLPFLKWRPLYSSHLWSSNLNEFWSASVTSLPTTHLVYLDSERTN